MSVYTLNNFTDIMMNGFEYSIPEPTIQLIMALSSQVGSPEYIKTPTWTKNANVNNAASRTNYNEDKSISRGVQNKKRRGNKGMEVENEEDWETLRSFQATKIEKKSGIDGQITELRLMLNKITDKTFIDLKDKIINLITELNANGEEVMNNVGNVVFDILSGNKFYSRLYAELYCNLMQEFPLFKTIANIRLNNYLSLFDTIKYVDPDKDYDTFCENNKLNEKRRACSEFLLNLTKNGIFEDESLVKILFGLMNILMKMINEDNTKNEVEELAENISILYNKELLTNYYSSTDDEEYYIDDNDITEVVQMLAKSKTKDFKSMSNKVLFKFMDLVDM